jgi:LacI family transcriptional regulator
MATIGVFLNWNRPDLRDCFRGICEYIREDQSGWQTVTHQPLKPGDSVESLTGVVVYSPRCETEWLHETGVPAVNLATQNVDRSLPQIGLDNEAIGRLAAEHLAQRGFRRFAFFTSAANRNARQRRLGFLRGIGEQGFSEDALVLDVDSFDPNAETQAGEMIGSLLETDAQPIGCFAFDDSAADSLLEQVKRVGLKVPERIGILGVNNNEFLCDTRFPTLTSIDPGNRARGALACRTLAEIIAGKPAQSPRPVPPVGVVVRGSTGFATTDDPIVDRAIAFIHTNARQSISVDDVVAHVKSNRTTLGRKFRQRLNTTPHQRILQEKIDQVKALLHRTDLDTQGIADAAGFVNRVHLSKLFKKMTGLTLIQFRKQVRAVSYRPA